MVAWIIGKLSLGLQLFFNKDSNRQRSAGIAIGVWIGIVPKDNLTAALLLTVLLATRATTAYGLLASAAVTFVAPLGDGLFDQIGVYLLSDSGLQGLWQSLFAFPIIPWTQLNNSVVLGATIAGGFAALLCYSIATRWMSNSLDESDQTHAAVCTALPTIPDVSEKTTNESSAVTTAEPPEAVGSNITNAYADRQAVEQHAQTHDNGQYTTATPRAVPLVVIPQPMPITSLPETGHPIATFATRQTDAADQTLIRWEGPHPAVRIRIPDFNKIGASAAPQDVRSIS